MAEEKCPELGGIVVGKRTICGQQVGGKILSVTGQYVGGEWTVSGR